MKSWRRFLLVDEWTSMGATVSDLTSTRTFHMTLTQIEEEGFIPFTYTSPHGKDRDLTLLVHPDLLPEDL